MSPRSLQIPAPSFRTRDAVVGAWTKFALATTSAAAALGRHDRGAHRRRPVLQQDDALLLQQPGARATERKSVSSRWPSITLTISSHPLIFLIHAQTEPVRHVLVLSIQLGREYQIFALKRKKLSYTKARY